MDNLNLYNKARVVPQEAQKSIQAGRLKGMTDINPMWRIKCLTELFGPCGVGWWYEITDKRIVEDATTNQSAAFVDILLYYTDPESGAASHGIPGTGGASFVAQERNGPYLSDECYKMALTDALSVAAKALGVAADIYYEKDRSKYTRPEPDPPVRDTKPDTKFRCVECGEVLKPYISNDKEIGIRRHAAVSEKKYGKVMCLDCINKLKAAEVKADE